MKNLNTRIQHIGYMIQDKAQVIPDRLAEKISAIRQGVDNDIGEDYLKQTQLEYSPIPIKLSYETQPYLPASKKTQIPAPNIVLRSALFGVIKKGARKYEKNILKTTLNGCTVKYTGEQLDQSDLDVWLECLQRCQSCQLGYTVRFSSNNFLLKLGRNTGKSDHEWLKSVLQRLRTNDIEISDGKLSYMGSLIFEQYRDEETGENCLVLNPKIAVFFGDAGWTGITKSIRLKLKGKPLTQWLHGFYSSHAKPLPVKVETLRGLCGSEVKELKKFRQMLRSALSELSIATGWDCNIDKTDKVLIKK